MDQAPSIISPVPPQVPKQNWLLLALISISLFGIGVGGGLLIGKRLYGSTPTSSVIYTTSTPSPTPGCVTPPPECVIADGSIKPGCSPPYIGEYCEPITLPTLNQSEIKYSGTISENDTSCNHDSVCKVKIGNYWVITDLGGDPNQEMEKQRGPKGKIYLVDGSRSGYLGGDEILGMNAEVFAKRISNNELSIYGSSEYYIKLLPQ